MSADTLALILTGVELLLIFFVTRILPILILGWVIYKISKKLIHHRIEYQYGYQQFKEAEAEINDIEADVKRHVEEDR